MAKKLLIIFSVISLISVIVLLVMLFFGYKIFGDKAILEGYINKEEHFDPMANQDSTDYCKYYYEESNDLFSESSVYSVVKREDIENIRSYFDNFKSRMNAGNRDEEYDFDDLCISEGDYFYIKSKGSFPDIKFNNYNIYLYDTESNTLFYAHSNI